ncbi:MAG: transposase, partial [Nitrospiraceae bacterium]
MWRYAVITLLREAARAGVLDTEMDRGALLRLLTAQYERWWNIDIKRFKSKKQFLGYAGRYARRPPIAQHRFRTISRQEIRFVTKDTRTKRTVEITYTPAEFLATLADHVPDRYRHNIRYFGLLAPRVKCQTHHAVFALLGQERLGKPRRLWWAASLQKSFGVDPLFGPRRPADALESSRTTGPSRQPAPVNRPIARWDDRTRQARTDFVARARKRLLRSPQSVSFQ